MLVFSLIFFPALFWASKIIHLVLCITFLLLVRYGGPFFYTAYSGVNRVKIKKIWSILLHSFIKRCKHYYLVYTNISTWTRLSQNRAVENRVQFTTQKLCQFFGILLYSDTGFHFSFPGLHLSLSLCCFFCQRSNHRINNAKNCCRFWQD
jgi:hypothetical protein